MTYLRCNLLIVYLVVHSFPVVEPMEPVIEFVALLNDYFKIWLFLISLVL